RSVRRTSHFGSQSPGTPRHVRFFCCSPLPRFVGIFPAPSADPFLRRWEGGISGRGGVPGTAANAAGVGPNREPKWDVRRSDLTVRVTARVTPRLTPARVTLGVRLEVRL